MLEQVGVLLEGCPHVFKGERDLEYLEEQPADHLRWVGEGVHQLGPREIDEPRLAPHVYEHVGGVEVIVLVCAQRPPLL